jgi:hypothetical protein
MRTASTLTTLISISTALFFLIFLNTAFSQQFDASGDGLSEIAYVAIDEDGNLDWQVRSSQSGFSTPVSGITSEFLNLGQSGDHLLIGDYSGTGQTLYGFIEDRSNQNSVRWNLRGTDGQITSVDFGNSKDVVVSGADFNQDGTSDIAVVRRVGPSVVRTSPFVAGVGQDIEVNFPKKASKKVRKNIGQVFFSPGRLGILYTNKRGKRNSRFKGVFYDFASEQRQNFSLRGRPRGGIIEVAAIQDASGSQNLLIHERLNRSTLRVSIYSFDGQRLYRTSLPGSTVLVGNFTSGASGEQFAVKNGSTVTVISPFNEGDNTTFTIGSGVVADLVNINIFTNTKRNNNNGGGNDNGGNSGGSTSLSRVCPKITGFTTGRLWKPDSDVSDARGGKPVLLLTGGNKGSRSPKRVYDRQGNVVCSGMTFKGSSIPGINKGAEHFFSGWVGGCGLTGGQMGSKARKNTGSKEVYVEWKNNTCLKVDDPDRRFGGI